MELTKRDYIRTFTTLGLAMCALEGFRFLGGVVYDRAAGWVLGQETGVLRWLSWLFLSDWTAILVRYMFVLGLPYLAVLLFLRRVPKFHGERRTIDGESFMILFVIEMGVGYLLNFLGNAVNMTVSMMNGKSFLEMNPVLDMMTDLTPGMIIYACLLGPFMEEVLFRGILLSRARRFGSRTAVVFCAVLFGLMHGNLSQFLYATAIGLILGYMAVRTNTIRYNVLLHILLNSYSTVLVMGEAMLSGTGLALPLIGYSLGILVMTLLFIIFSVILLARHWDTGRRALAMWEGARSPNKKYVYLNAGFLLYAALCVTEMLLYLLY